MESLLKIDSIIQALILGVMSWAAMNIEHIKQTQSDMFAAQQVNSVEILHLKDKVNRLENYHHGTLETR